MKKEKAILEATLFAMGAAVPIEKLARAIAKPKDVTEKLLEELKQEYQKEVHGIQLVQYEDAYQFATKPMAYDALITLINIPVKTKLTDVLLETLAIIAYQQPVTKLEIEKIRGVKSDHAVNKLVEYGLVLEVGRRDTIGKPILFGTTEAFLRNFGLHSLEELPQIEEQS